jgi:hypothetical protein
MGDTKLGMALVHPTPRFAAVIRSGAYREYNGHPAAPDWSAQVDPWLPFVTSSVDGQVAWEADIRTPYSPRRRVAVENIGQA